MFLIFAQRFGFSEHLALSHYIDWHERIYTIFGGGRRNSGSYSMQDYSIVDYAATAYSIQH
jgi:hypothetical protein